MLVLRLLQNYFSIFIFVTTTKGSKRLILASIQAAESALASDIQPLHLLIYFQGFKKAELIYGMK